MCKAKRGFESLSCAFVDGPVLGMEGEFELHDLAPPRALRGDEGKRPRRRVGRWTEAEVAALEEGVRRLGGPGNW